MKKKRADIDQYAYRKARAKFLTDWDDACHWCHRRKAVQVDHVIPVDAGADPTDQGNWVGSCAQCNAKRGADYLAAKRQGLTKQRQKRKKSDSPADFFGGDQTIPDRKSVV